MGSVCLTSLSERQVKHLYIFVLNARWHSKNWTPLNHVIAETIFNEDNRNKFIMKLQRTNPIRIKQNSHVKKAAVLVPFCMVQNEISLLYTLRSSQLKSYSGQVSFPGGMLDNKDRSLEETACRETCEEIGIRRSDIEIWGHGNIIGTAKREVVVLPYVGYIGEIDVKNLVVNKNEVESVFTVPIRMFCDSNHCTITTMNTEGFSIPEFLCAEHRIWGLTAIITHLVLKALIPDIYKYDLNVSNS